MTARIIDLFEEHGPSGRPDHPLLAVVDATGRLGEWLRSLCDMLGIALHILPDASMLGRSLDRHAPLAIVCADFNDEGQGFARVLRLIADYDRATPTLLVTGSDPETLGQVDAAIELWPLTRVERVAGDVRIETVLDFLSRAGRASGAMRLMAV